MSVVSRKRLQKAESEAEGCLQSIDLKLRVAAIGIWLTLLTVVLKP